MTTLLFSVIAAASLAVAGSVAPSDTRPAQSLPSEHLVVASPNAVTGKLHSVNRLADAMSNDPGQDEADKTYCEHHGGHWDDVKKRCHHVLAWPVAVIGAATTAGFIYALTSHNDSPSNQSPVSN